MVSERCVVTWNICCRVSAVFTGRLSWRAAIAAKMASALTQSLEPDPPPMKGLISRTFSTGISRVLATASVRRRRRHAWRSKAAHAQLTQGNEGSAESASPFACASPMDRRNDRHKGVQHMPGEEVGLVGERPESRSNYLANLLLGFGLKALAATIRARWIC